MATESPAQISLQYHSVVFHIINNYIKWQVSLELNSSILICCGFFFLRILPYKKVSMETVVSHVFKSW